MDQFWTILWSAVGIIVTGLATWLVTVVTNFFNKKIKNEKLNKWANDVFNIVMNAVLCITQTFVDDLKKAGKFDKEAAQEAKEKAYRIIMSQLTPELQTYIQENFGDIQEYIMNLIETVVHQLKK